METKLTAERDHDHNKYPK